MTAGIEFFSNLLEMFPGLITGGANWVGDPQGNNLFNLTDGQKKKAEPSLILPFIFYPLDLPEAWR